MDGETQKPFACKAKGCGMSFTNEDHLTVHEKKHDMILNLGITSKAAGAFIADQTPTPTRLIKNCEDVGLFDDLKNVNPFDETFRRAVECKSNVSSIEISSTSESLNQTDESLHTPQVFPNFDSSSATTKATTTDDTLEFKVQKQKLILPENISDKQNRQSRKSKQSINRSPQTVKVSRPARQPVNILPTPSSPNPPKPIMVPATAINLVPTGQLIAFSIPTTAIMQRPLLLPKVLTHSPLSSSSPVTSDSVNQSPELSVKDKLKAHLSSPRIPSPIDKSQIKDTKRLNTNKQGVIKSPKQSPEEIQDDCMERRRAASLRYRRKIKHEQIDLKRRNAELVAENSQLRALVKQLKELLSTQQNNGNCVSSQATTFYTSGQQIPNAQYQFVTAGKILTPSTAFQIPVATPVQLILQDPDNSDSNYGPSAIKIKGK